MATPYSQLFYATYQDDSRSSAAVIAPIVNELIRPQSVVDVGCGIGTWLSVWRELGVRDAIGVDGDYVSREQLLIPAEMFLPRDLTRPLALDREFDLVSSLEVAEHLPEICADSFVHSLTALAPAVLFSAAIPHQGGDHHVNEQWPEYWVAKFAARGYTAFDCIRPAVWNDPKVAYYYAQNAFIFVRRERLSQYESLRSMPVATGPLARVHPHRWAEANDPKRQPLPPLLQALPHSVSSAASRRLRRWFGQAKR